MSKAPGPDGVSSRVWALAMSELGPRTQALYTACLREGKFPANWKKANLVLLKKKGKPTDTPSARPICLLDEVGKLFELIITTRVV